MATEVGQLSIALTLDNKSLNSSIKETESTVTSGFTVIKGAMAGLVAQGVSAAIGSMKEFAASVAEVGMSFDSAMAKVAAISGATGDELASLAAKAQEMGATTKFTATEAAEGLTYMAMAGWKTQDMLKGLPGIINLAAAADADLAEASDIVTDALTAFGASAEDAARLADIMAAASANSNTNVSLMGETFKYVAPVAGALGYSMEDTATAIGLMANAGIKGSQAGTALRTILTNLTKPTATMAKGMAQLGISITEANGEMKPMSQVLEELRFAFSGLSEAERASYAATIAGKEGMSALLAIVGASDDDFNNLAAAINNSTGAAEKMSNTMLNNLPGQLTLLRSAFEGIQLSIYNAFLPALTQAAGGLSDLVSAISNALSGEGDVDGAIQRFIENFGSALVEGLSKLGEIMGKVGPVLIQAFVGIIPDLVQGLLNAMTTVITSVAEKLPDIMESIVNAIMQIATKLTEPQNLQAILNAFLQLMLATVKAIPKIIVAIIKALPQIIMNIVDFLTDPATIVMILEAAVEMFMAIVEAVPEILFALLEALGNLIGMIVERIGEAFTWLGEHFSELPAMIGQWLGEAFGKFGEWIGQMLGKVGEFGGQFLAKIGEFFSQLPGNLWNFLMEALGKIGEFVGSAVQWAFEAGSQFLGTIGEFFSQLPGNIAAFLGEVINNIVTWIGELIGKAVEAGSQFLQNILNFFKQLPSNIWNWLTQTIQKVVSFVSDFVAKAIQAGKDFFDGIVNKVKEIPGQMLEIGKNIVEGIWNGISGAAGWLWDQIKNFCSGIVDKIKGFFHIGSPSKLFADEVGVFLAQGIEVGFGDEMDDVNTKMTHDIETSLNLPEMAGAGLEGWLSPILSNMAETDTDNSANGEAMTIIQNNTINDQLDIQQVSEALLEEIRMV